MCFWKLRKRLNKIQDSIDNLYTFVKTKEYDKLKKDSVDLKEEQELLSHLAFDLKDVRIVEDDNGFKHIKIWYKQPIIILDIDPDTKEPIKNNIFYSINRLNLTNLQDMEKIQNALKEIKNNS